MRIERFDAKTDEHLLRACHHVVVSGQPEDDPDVPAVSYGCFRGWWAFGLSGEPMQSWIATGEDGQIVGCYQLELPDRENTGTGFCYPVVALTARRRGIGTALLAHCAGQAQQAGRTLLMSNSRIGSPGFAFAAALGAKPGLQDARRVLDVGPEFYAGLPALRAQAEPHAAGYWLRYWTGPVPDELVLQNCALEDAMADAPHDESVEPARWDPDRLRAADTRLAEQGTTRYSIAAMHEATGEMAAITQLTIDPDVHSWAFQEITAVTRQHRGHRLGMLVKVAMLEQLAVLEPQVSKIMTFNAVQNEHMIAVNAGLGHRATDYFQGFELTVAAALAATASPLAAGR